MADRDFILEVSEEALSTIAKVGFDPVYGARPLKRAIQQYVENPVAQEILSGKLSAGRTIHLGVENGEVVARH